MLSRLSMTRIIISQIKLFVLILSAFVQTVFATAPSTAQKFSEQGLPFIENFSPDTYEAHVQNWAIIQDQHGFMYVANTDGVVLQYDGVTWRRIPVTNGSIVRSFAMDSSGTIYVGAQNEIGYLAPDPTGSLQYRSLMKNIADSLRNFGNVWQIHATSEYLYFSTRKYLFRMDFSGKVKTWTSGTTFHASFLLPGRRLLIHQMETGLMELKNDSLQMFPEGNLFSDDWVYSVLPVSGDSLLIGSRNKGLFVYNGTHISGFRTQADTWLKKNQLYCGTRLSNGYYAYTTLRAGVLILDKYGNLHTLINKNGGLQDDNVWYAYEDNNHLLWLAMNNGIAHVQFPGSFTLFNERNGLEGNVQDVVRHHNVLYSATGRGVYRLKPGDEKNLQPEFEHLPGLKSQCWSLLSLPEALLVSSNHGIFIVKGSTFKKISDKSAWQIVPSKQDPNRVFLGLDDGLASLYKTASGWIDEGRYADFTAEARTLAEQEPGKLWIGTVYEGIYRLNFHNPGARDPFITHFTQENGLPSRNYNLAFPGKPGVLFGTTHGIFRFIASEERFVELTFSGDVSNYSIDTTSYTILHIDKDQNVWFNCNDKPALARFRDNGYHLQIKSFLNAPEASIYTYYTEDDGTVWAGGTKGILRFEAARETGSGHNFNIYIRRVSIGRDSVIYGGTSLPSRPKPLLSYTENALRFEFAATSFISSSANQYQYLLDGFDTEWSGWSAETKKDYTNLNEGFYTFRVRAKDVFGTISSEAVFPFEILPPWYRTFWAYLTYLLILSLGIYLFSRFLISSARERTIRERKKIEMLEKQAEEKLRSRVAADFHDELGNRITKISLFSEIIKSNFGKDSGKVLEYLEKINDNANNLYNETRDFIWHLDPQKDTLSDLVMRLKSFGDELFDGTDIVFKVSGSTRELKDIRLSMDWRQHILRIFKEALHNVLKYAQCRKVKLSISRTKNGILLTLKDDGTGFDVSIKKEGIGLANIARRAQAIGAGMEIDSQPGQGTMIRLTLNLP